MVYAQEVDRYVNIIEILNKTDKSGHDIIVFLLQLQLYAMFYLQSVNGKRMIFNKTDSSTNLTPLESGLEVI